MHSGTLNAYSLVSASVIVLRFERASERIKVEHEVRAEKKQKQQVDVATTKTSGATAVVRYFRRPAPVTPVAEINKNRSLVDVPANAIEKYVHTVFTVRIRESTRFTVTVT
jgi:hypothetical protein